VYVFSNGSLACTRPDGAVWGMPRRIELALFAAGYIYINVVYHFGKEYHLSYSPPEIALTLNAHSDQLATSTTAIVVASDAAENYAFNFTEDLWDSVGLAKNPTIQATGLLPTKRPDLQHAVQSSSFRDIFTDNVTKSMHSLKTRLLRNTPEGNEDRIAYFDLIESFNKIDITRATASTVARKLALGFSSLTTSGAVVVVPAIVSNGSKRKSSSTGGTRRSKK